MRLSMEEVQKQHESTKKLYEQGLTVAPVDVKRVLDLYDTIEALQQKIEQLKEQINTAKIGWDTYKTYSEQLEQQTAESNKIIETQRQEIEKLKATLADWKYNAKCDADLIESLQAQLRESQCRADAAVEDMKHIANKISQCKGFLSGGEDRVQDLKLGRCDVCKGICYRDEPCKFEWRGPQEG